MFYQSLTLSHIERFLLFLALTGVAAININSATIDRGLNISVGYLGKCLLSLSDKMKYVLRKKFTGVTLINEISMVSNYYLYTFIFFC